MNTTTPTVRQIAFMQIHALACREYARENPTESRKAELRDIIRTCEVEMSDLTMFRVAEPCLEGLTRDLVSDAVRYIEAPTPN